MLNEISVIFLKNVLKHSLFVILYSFFSVQQSDSVIHICIPEKSIIKGQLFSTKCYLYKKNSFLIKKNFLLKYGQFTMLCQSLLYSKGS